MLRYKKKTKKTELELLQNTALELETRKRLSLVSPNEYYQNVAELNDQINTAKSAIESMENELDSLYMSQL